eukprot:m51a1_g9825 hypothetical protein (719) ;mRNA; f:1910375-1912950
MGKHTLKQAPPGATGECSYCGDSLTGQPAILCTGCRGLFHESCRAGVVLDDDCGLDLDAAPLPGDGAAAPADAPVSAEDAALLAMLDGGGGGGAAHAAPAAALRGGRREDSDDVSKEDSDLLAEIQGAPGAGGRAGRAEEACVLDEEEAAPKRPVSAQSRGRGSGEKRAGGAEDCAPAAATVIATRRLETKEDIDRAIEEEKRLAVECKRKNDTTGARAHLAEYHRLQTLAPAVPAAAPVSSAAASEEHRREAFDAVEHSWRERAEQLKRDAVAAKAAGDRVRAVELYRECKLVVADLEALQRARADPAVPAPAFRAAESVARVERVNEGVMPNELEVVVVRAMGLVVPGHSKLSPYVYGEVRLLDSDAQTRLQTRTAAGDSNPRYDESFRVPIQRCRALLRLAERRKLALDVYHKRSLLGSLHVGHCEVPLEPLLRSSEARQVVPVLKPGSRRPIADGATLEVVLRLREPLACKDVQEVRHQYLVLTSPVPGCGHSPLSQAACASAGAAAPAPTAAAAAAVPPPAKRPASAAVATAAAAVAAGRSAPATPTAGKRPAAVSPGPAPAAAARRPASADVKPKTAAAAAAAAAGGAAPVAAGAAGATEEERDRLVVEANNADRLVSNDVLDWELARKVPGEDAAEAASRRQMIEAKQTVLVVQVQTGRITMDQYLASLRKACEDEALLARRLAAAGLAAEQRVCLQRIEIMKKEIEGASE